MYFKVVYTFGTTEITSMVKSHFWGSSNPPRIPWITGGRELASAGPEVRLCINRHWSTACNKAHMLLELAPVPGFQLHFLRQEVTHHPFPHWPEKIWKIKTYIHYFHQFHTNHSHLTWTFICKLSPRVIPASLGLGLGVFVNNSYCCVQLLCLRTY